MRHSDQTVRIGDDLADARWDVETVEDAASFSALAPEWDDLYEACRTATPFQAHAWLDSCWRHYGRPGRLLVVLLRRDGRLVAAAPLMRMRRWGYPLVGPIGLGLSDFMDFLVRDGERPATISLLARALISRTRGRVIDIPEVPPDAVVGRVAGVWPARAWRCPSSVCLELPGRPLDEIAETLPVDLARRIRKRSRRIDRDGDIAVRTLPSRDAGTGVADLLRLHELDWRGRGINPEHLEPRYAAHLSDASRAMIDRGQAAILEWRRDGQVMAVELTVVGHRFVGGYLYGAHPDLRNIDVNTLLTRDKLALTYRLERPIYQMMRGAEPHKLRFMPTAVPNERWLLSGTHRLSARCYATAVLGRDRALRIVRDRFPALASAAVRARGAWAQRRTRGGSAHP